MGIVLYLHQFQLPSAQGTFEGQGYMPTFVLENSFQFARVKLIHPEELSNLNLIKTPDFFTHFRCILYCAGAENDVFAGKFKKLIYIIVRLATTRDTMKCIFHW